MKKFTLQDYKNAVKGVGPKMKEHIIDRAIREQQLDWPEIKALIDCAYHNLEVC